MSNADALSKVLSLLPLLQRSDLFTVIAAAQSLTLRNTGYASNRGGRAGRLIASKSGPKDRPKVKLKKEKGSFKPLKVKEHVQHVENLKHVDYVSFKAAEKTLKAYVLSQSEKFDLGKITSFREPKDSVTMDLKDYEAKLRSSLDQVKDPQLQGYLLSFFMLRQRWFRRKIIAADVGSQPSSGDGKVVEPIVKDEGKTKPKPAVRANSGSTKAPSDKSGDALGETKVSGSIIDPKAAKQDNLATATQGKQRKINTRPGENAVVRQAEQPPHQE